MASLPVIENLDQAFAFFEGRSNLEKGLPLYHSKRLYRLERMKALCEAYGNPQESYCTVHVAGSKGKGSTCAFISALLKKCGHKVGIYSSPHLLDYRERFRIEGELFPEEDAYFTVKKLIEKLALVEKKLPGGELATTFELLTLFAFVFFRDSGCQSVVLETGLGGRLDATNVVKGPKAVVITPIEMEHAEILGPSLIDIADEKAGIIKRGSPVFFSAQKPGVERRIRHHAERLGCACTSLQDLLRSITAGPSLGAEERNMFSWNFAWKDGSFESISLLMGGCFQAENAALALATVRSIHPECCRGDLSALSQACLPGRFEFLQHDPPIVIDGAHTVNSISGLLEAFVNIPAVKRSRSSVLLFGCVEGKDHAGMAAALCGREHPYFSEVLISKPGTFKASNLPEIASSFRRFGATVVIIDDPLDAWRAAKEKAGMGKGILVTGSFFMAGAIAEIWNVHGGVRVLDSQNP